MSAQSVNTSIEHDGIVESSENGIITVKISQVSACTGCHAEGYCSLSGKEEKQINIPGNYDFSKGDRVIVQMKQSTGFKALFLSYILPLIILLMVLIILISVRTPELTAGLAAISVLMPYYFIIWLLRNKINKTISFNIKV
jgi:sigma-E factor negative regulatory protein RseC